MPFQTWTFALLWAAVWPVYLLLSATRFRGLWLLAASYGFYACVHPLYPFVVLYVTAVDYLAVAGMATTRFKRLWLLVSLLNGLALLAVFKYTGFAVETANGLLRLMGVGYALPAPRIRLPAGLPFYLFQSLTYTIGFYRGEVEREKNFIRYAAFVAMFPQLLMGPIERARNILPQLRHGPNLSAQNLADGLSLFIVGLFKKLVLADWLGLYVGKVYTTPWNFEAPALILATLAFSWQLYFDFSGYSDMARGVARTLGIRLMLNFNHPYLATGLGDFWRRWHISLSTWFRDYVYIPMGGNRRGTWATYRNMFLTMVISGLWHEARWTFVIWGVYHGLGRVLTRHLEQTGFYRQRVPRAAKTLWVFLFVSFGWIFFRAESWADARLIIARIARFAWADPAVPWVFLAMVGAVWLYQAIYESKLRAALHPAPVRIGIVVLLILGTAVFAQSGVQPFVYSQFGGVPSP
ncbi:MAG: MBOAT family O-acyltransferase [Thermoguttaceae bacterium]